jgi:hypothetical protein
VIKENEQFCFHVRSEFGVTKLPNYCPRLEVAGRGILPGYYQSLACLFEYISEFESFSNQ